MQIPHVETSTVSTPHRNDPTLASRHRIWEILCRAGAPLAWLPRTCDVAMNHYPHAESVAEICSAPDFARHCAAHPHPYSDLTMTSTLALAALSDPARPLFRRYIQAQFRRLAGYCVFSHEQARLDARELLEDTFYALLPKYKVGGMSIEGEIVTWGWEAFLAERLVWSAGTTLRARGHFVHEDIDSAAGWGLADEPSNPIRHADSAAVRDAVCRVLDAEIDTPLAEATYRDLVYAGKSYEEVAAQLGCSHGSIGYRVIVPLIAKLQERLAAEGFGDDGKVSFRRLRAPLAQTVPLATFNALMANRLPSPVGRNNLHAGI